MIQSMTAFVRKQKQFDGGVLCWEIRSVNHRYLDLSFRLPESLRFIEPQLRMALRGVINRGKIECQLKYQDTADNNNSMLINIGIVNALTELSTKLATSHQLANDMSVSQVLAWPGAVQVGSMDSEPIAEQALVLFTEALQDLSQFRTQEGAALKQTIQERLNALEQEIEKAKGYVGDTASVTKDKWLTRLHALQLEVAEGRLEQEMALMLTRLDVSEELDRLKIHCNEVNRSLTCDKIAGRRLDFLMQELNREANTLSSKSDSVALTQAAVEMKVLIEQMREQIQNIE